MSKRATFTTVTPLPPHITRASVVSFLHNYEAMIDINPLVTDRYRIPPPKDADPDEAGCVWYQLTDAVAMPWSASSPTTRTASAVDSAAAKTKSGNVSYTCAFHPLSDGLQTHCRAPLGVDIRDRWTVGGNERGEPRQPVELGLEALGAPKAGLYLREDVDLRCNRLMAGFVKKTLKKSHEAVVQKLNSDLASTGAPVMKSPLSPSGQFLSESIPSNIRRSSGCGRSRKASTKPFSRSQNIFKSCGGSSSSSRSSSSNGLVPSSIRHHTPHLRLISITSSIASNNSSIFFTITASTSTSTSIPTLILKTTPVPASLAVGPPPSKPNARQAQHHQQNQQNQRTLHPHFPQHSCTEASTSNKPSSLSLPGTSLASVSTTATASTVAGAVSPSSSPSPSPRLTPPAVHYDRFKMTASPLTRLQLQLPRVSAFVPPPMVAAAEIAATSNDTKIASNDSFAEKEQRHLLYQQLLPPLVFSAREVASTEPRRKSTGSDAASAVGNSGLSDVDSLPFHNLSLCPQPLRIGGQRRASAGQPQQPPNTTQQPLTLLLPKKEPLNPTVQPQTEQTYLPSQPLKPFQQVARAVEEPVEEAAPAIVQMDYPEMNPYVYNEDDYEDILVVTPVDTPILATDNHEQHNGPYSPTVFAEFDNGTKSGESATLESVAAAPVPDWQQWRKFLSQDMD
ncbi:hypothetical protein SCUCBS95973_006771 [Sporothrix curviconia]|uniref:DUF7053 domain-containing protein n=1 Tax=Sporothrix curviconia TaxID=1260050 RepID=A0ABP0C7W1_9PEZI